MPLFFIRKIYAAIFKKTAFAQFINRKSYHIACLSAIFVFPAKTIDIG